MVYRMAMRQVWIVEEAAKLAVQMVRLARRQMTVQVVFVLTVLVRVRPVRTMHSMGMRLTWIAAGLIAVRVQTDLHVVKIATVLMVSV